ncbi:peptide chain release factor N(5)-glutamine methyltransferase [Virgibacillus halophilus]
MENIQKQYEVLNWASFFLKEHHCEENAAQMLLQHYLGVTRAQLFARMQDPVPLEVMQQFERAVRQHAETGIPVQHLMGYTEFYGRRFSVNEAVLIPRQETEELIYHAISYLKGIVAHHPSCTIVDVGTGSGIIAITLALELPQTTVFATDISGAALEMAKKNAEQHGADITFLQGNFLEPIANQAIKADLIVSNPPYIAWSEAESLSKTVKDYDPALALFAEDDGLAAYREIIRQLPAVLEKQGKVMFEIGHQQGQAVKEIIVNAFPESEPDVLQDMNGKDRMVSALVKK